MLVVGISSQTQGPIVDETRTAKRTSQYLLLLVGGVYSILVRSFLFHILYDITQALFICGLSAGSALARFYRMRAGLPLDRPARDMLLVF